MVEHSTSTSSLSRAARASSSSRVVVSSSSRRRLVVVGPGPRAFHDYSVIRFACTLFFDPSITCIFVETDARARRFENFQNGRAVERETTVRGARADERGARNGARDGG